MNHIWCVHVMTLSVVNEYHTVRVACAFIQVFEVTNYIQCLFTLFWECVYRGKHTRTHTFKKKYDKQY